MGLLVHLVEEHGVLALVHYLDRLAPGSCSGDITRLYVDVLSVSMTRGS